MTSQNAVLKLNEDGEKSIPAPVGEGSKAIVDTRFGPLEFGQENAIFMPRGLLGFTDFHDYGLTGLQNPGLEQFMLLQCLEEEELSFVVIPLNRDGESIDEQDILDACAALSLNPPETAVLLVVSTRSMGKVTQISVNLRAPVIVDTKAHKGWQQVLPNSRYPVRHVISEVAQSDQG